MSSQALPTPEQVAWADCEIGVIIHLDVQVFEPGYEFRKQRGYCPSPKVFNPALLDTDQWLDVAVKAGAKYAVLVAKHCSGFSLWPTKAHEYSVASSPWRSGTGDIVADFFSSCARHGVKPGLYCSASCNAYLGVDNPGTVLSGDAVEQKRYNEIVLRQLTELWTNYGDVFEIWFDGGCLPPAKGGPDITSLLTRLQPKAVVFQGPEDCRSLLRWVGNERGEAPYPCWSATNVISADDGTKSRLDLKGDPDGARWAPAESDMPNRDQHKAFQGGWFWRKGEDHLAYSVEHLVERYYQSVGRNTNLLLGMVIDDRGLVPGADCRKFEEFGKEIGRHFSELIASDFKEGNSIEIEFLAPSTVSHVVIMEDITSGERIRGYELQVKTSGDWTTIATGSCVGHKRIERFAPIEAAAIALRVTDSRGTPRIRAFSAYAPAP